MNPARLAASLLEDEFDPKEFVMRQEFKRELWAFTDYELATDAYKNARRDDEFFATVRLDDSTEDRDESNVIVLRNGEVTDRFTDGTVGVPDQVKRLAAGEETLFRLWQPDKAEPGYDDEVAERWRYVLVDDNGGFMRFAPRTFQ